MSARVVMVTGVSRYLSGALARALAADPSIKRVIGVDSIPKPIDDSLGAFAEAGSAEFVRADVRSPLIAKAIERAEVDTVVHMDIATTPRRAGGRTSMKDLNVLGTMQLLAACQNAPSVKRFILKSTNAVYGSSSRNPALFTEQMQAKSTAIGGLSKDIQEVEGYVRGFSRRRPDVNVSVLRFSNFIGPSVPSTLATYFAMPVIPTIFGYDPRIQLLHEDDGVEILRQAILCRDDRYRGIVNVAGDGVMFLSQAIRRAGHVGFPVISPAAKLAGGVLQRLRLADFSAEQTQFLQFGRVMDTSKMHDEVKFKPRFSIDEAFDTFVQSLPQRASTIHRVARMLPAQTKQAP